MESMQPAFEDETLVNPYDFWEGAEFKIKIRKVEGWVNYDKSEFLQQPLLWVEKKINLKVYMTNYIL